MHVAVGSTSVPTCVDLSSVPNQAVIIKFLVSFCSSMSGFGVNRNPGFNMNNSISNNIFNGTGKDTCFQFLPVCYSEFSWIYIFVVFLDFSHVTFSVYSCADGSENVTGLDLSDFPALADRSRRDGGSNPTPLLNPLAGRAPYGERHYGPVRGKNLDIWCLRVSTFKIPNCLGIVHLHL